MRLLRRKSRVFENVAEIKRRSDVFLDMGFMPTMRDTCPLEAERWRPGSVYARGDERICIHCLCGWGDERWQAIRNERATNVEMLNILNYQPRTMEEIGAALYPDGFALLPPGRIVPT